LPAVYSTADSFLATFLRAFEHVLTGVGDGDDPGFEEILDGGATTAQGQRLAGIQRYFDPGLVGRTNPPLQLPAPQAAPDEFLPWLAQWVALVPRADVSSTTLRLLIARAVELYRLRGTKDGIVQLLSIYGLDVEIAESESTPFHFTVTAPIPTSDTEVLNRWSALARAIIDFEKPAYTTYDLDPHPIQWQVEVTATVGVDTLLADDLNVPA
jgi:hypothetical protein